MKKLDNIVQNKKLKVNQLQEYGFQEKNGTFFYEKKINEGKFIVQLFLNRDSFKSRVIDEITKEEYILVDVPSACGKFILTLRKEYQEVLDDVIDKCFENEVYTSDDFFLINAYIKDKYHDDPEYLFQKSPGNAFYRNKKNKRWYAFIIKIPGEKLISSLKEEVEIIDLKYPKDKLDILLNDQRIFRGYHMNKKNWITIILNSGFSLDEIKRLIDISHNLSM